MKPIRHMDSLSTIKNCNSYLNSELFFKDLKLNNDDYTIESPEDVEIIISLIEALSAIVKCHHAEWRMIVEDDESDIGIVGAISLDIARTFLMSYVNKQETLLIKGRYRDFIGIYSLESNERVACITSRYCGI